MSNITGAFKKIKKIFINISFVYAEAIARMI